MDNILVRFEEASVILEYVESQSKHPMPRKIKDGRTIYQSHNNFGDLKSYLTLPEITDFSHAQRVNGLELFRYKIQPAIYRAPEVLLHSGWSYSADIWNLGVLVRAPDFIGARDSLLMYIYRYGIC